MSTTPQSPAASSGSPSACGCPCCRTRHLMGAVVLITLGVLLALQTVWHRWNFSHTWPVLLIVIGVVKLVQYFAPRGPSHSTQAR